MANLSAVSDIKQWAYQAYDNSPGMHRWEIGSRIMSSLEETVGDKPDDGPGPRLPHALLFGYPLRVDEALAPNEWRTVDNFGTVLAAGVFDGAAA